MTSLASFGSRSTSESLSSSSSCSRRSSSSGTSSRSSASSRAASRSSRVDRPLLRELVGRFELLQPPSRLGCRLPVGEDRRVAHALLRLSIGAFELLDQVFDAASWRSRHRLRPSWNRCMEAASAEPSASRCTEPVPATSTTATAPAAASTRARASGLTHGARVAVRASGFISGEELIARLPARRAGCVKAFCSRLRIEPLRKRRGRMGTGDLHPLWCARRRPRHPARVPHLRRLDARPGTTCRTTACPAIRRVIRTAS